MKIMKVMKNRVIESDNSIKELGTYNPELDKYVGTVMCPDKVAKGREMLKNVPPDFFNRQVKK